MKYRFTAEDFDLNVLVEPTLDPRSHPDVGRYLNERAAQTANALLEKWEAESTHWVGNLDGYGFPYEAHFGPVTHQAVLWNPQPIKEKKE